MPRIRDLVRYFTPIQSRLIAAPNGGWVDPDPNQTAPLTYASATTINVTGADATLYYQIGWKARYKQGGNYKYGIITGVTSSVIALTGGSDYSIANAEITDFEVSESEQPLGFPQAFNWSPTYTGFSVNPQAVCRFKTLGRSCHIAVHTYTNGISNSNLYYMTAPITAAGVSNMIWGNTAWRVTDNGAVRSEQGVVLLSAFNTTIAIEPQCNIANWTNANGKGASYELWYEF